MKVNNQDIWVFIETTSKGQARDCSLELLTPGYRLSQGQGGKLVAVLLGNDLEDAVATVNAYGPDQILVVDRPELARYTTDAYADILCALVRRWDPATILVSATPNGRDMAPRVACRLRTGLTADCTGLDVDEDSGKVNWTRPTFGGNLMAVIQCPRHRPQMGTVRPGVFAKPQRMEGYSADVIREDISLEAGRVRTTLLDIVEEVTVGEVDIREAEIIVAGGRGMGGPGGFVLIRQLAEALGAVVGASRAAVDAGWMPRAYQIGQTGKTVSPKLYIACGISGAVQHRVGMSGADCIVAINCDSEAPIFGIADYGVVGNVHEILPALTDELRKQKNESIMPCLE